MSTATQRKAWNEAMRSAGAVLPASGSGGGGAMSAAGGAMGGPSRRGGVASRAADRRRKRRNNARKTSIYGDGGAGGGSSALEEKEYRVAIHMDMLEGVTDNAALEGDNDDDEYDEFAELDADSDDDDDSSGSGKGKSSKGKGKKKKRKRKSASAGGGANKNKKASASAVPKYLKPRALASILMEEASRLDSMAQQYVNASVCRSRSGYTTTTTTTTSKSNSSTTATTETNPYPQRKLCPATGLFGEYTEPKTGIPYASLSALEKIRERPPPWLSAGVGSSASYWEAVKSLQNNYS